MKKLKLALTLCLAALLLLSACGDKNVQPSADPAPASPGSSAAPDETAAPAAAPEPEPEEEEPRIRQLTVEELDELTENLDYNENGFFVCSYYRPEEIDWSEVFYNGAGIALDVTEELKADYERTNYEIICDLTIVALSDVEKFVMDKTGTDYAEARHPIDWPFSYNYGVYMSDHGDTNLERISFTGGWVSGDEYHLFYDRDDWRSGIDGREFEMTAFIKNEQWQYVSNLPTDAEPPVTLLDVDFFETEEEAGKATGVTDFVDLDLSDSDPTSLLWAVITARTDNVRYTVDKAVRHNILDEILFMEYGVNVPGENVASGVLNEGERIAVHLSKPWYPDYRIMATKDNYYGDYWVGEDNWLHMDNGVTRYVAGHDLQSEGRGCSPENRLQLINFLSDGTWLYFDPDTGETKAAVTFYDYYLMDVLTEDARYTLSVDYDYLFAELSDAPDLLLLKKSDINEYSDWSALPEWFTIDELGDYTYSAVQMDGEQILTLNQANNGDAALGYLLGAGDGVYSFTLVRYKGTAEFEGQG